MSSTEDEAEIDRRFVPRDDPSIKIFDTEPRHLVKELREFVKATGTPDLWRWHLHTKPPADSRPVLMARNIVVPESLRPRVGKAPCPVCSLGAPKYYKGWLAYFPEEECVRVIGRECGRTFFGEHAFATLIANFDQRKNDERAIGFLIENLGKVPSAVGLAAALSALAPNLDATLRGIRTGVPKTTAEAILRYAGAAALPLFEERRVSVIGRDGQETTHRERFPAGVVPVRGLDVFRAAGGLAVETLQRASSALEGLSFADEDAIADALQRWLPLERIDASKRMQEAWTLISDARALFELVRAFLAPGNVAALMRWGSDPRASVRVRAIIDVYGRLKIGGAKGDMTIVPVHPELLTVPLPILQRLS